MTRFFFLFLRREEGANRQQTFLRGKPQNERKFCNSAETEINDEAKKICCFAVTLLFHAEMGVFFNCGADRGPFWKQVGLIISEQPRRNLK